MGELLIALTPSSRAEMVRSVVGDIADNIADRESRKSHARSCSKCRASGKSKHQIISDLRYARRQLMVIIHEIEKERA